MHGQKLTNYSSTCIASTDDHTVFNLFITYEEEEQRPYMVAIIYL